MTGKDLNIKKNFYTYFILSASKLIPSGHLTFFLSFAWFCNLQSETLYQDNCNHELNLD